MITQYRLTDSGGATALFDTPEEAAAASGHPDLRRWHHSPDDHDWRWVSLGSHHPDLGAMVEWLIDPVRTPECDADRIQLAVKIAIDSEFGQREHHRWTVDQMLRVLLGDRYDTVITQGVGGWDTGAPDWQ